MFFYRENIFSKISEFHFKLASYGFFPQTSRKFPKAYLDLQWQWNFPFQKKNSPLTYLQMKQMFRLSKTKLTSIALIWVLVFCFTQKLLGTTVASTSPPPQPPAADATAQLRLGFSCYITNKIIHSLDFVEQLNIGIFICHIPMPSTWLI